MKKLLTICTMFSIGFMLSCSDNSDPRPKADDIVYYKGTQSPGDVWEWSINRTNLTMTASWDAGTFDDINDDVSIEGEVEVFDSGFLKVTITAASGGTEVIPTDGTAFFYALEVPNTALIIKPEGSIKGDLISMVAQGDANNMAGDYNYVIIAPGNGANYNPTIEEAIGQVTIAPGVGGFDITGSAKSLDCYDGGNCTYSNSIGGVPTAIVEENGNFSIYEENGNTKAAGQFTDAGVLMVDFGYGNGGVFALEQNNIAKSDIFNTVFNGIAYLPAGDDKTLPVNVVFSGTGVGEGHPYTSIEENVINEVDGITMTVSSIENGLISGTVSHQSGDTPFAGAILKEGDDYIMVISSTTNEVGNPPFILLLTTK